MSDPRRALAHPVVWLAALAVLANDFFLRGRAPSWLTDRLSDVGWLVLVPVLLAPVLAWTGRPRRLAIVIAGVFYTLLQLCPPLGRALKPDHVADAADLLALPRGPIAWWGTVPAATVPTTGVALAWEGATERWAWHLHVGQAADAWWAFAYTWQTWDLDAIVTTVQPIAGAWSLVAEAEVLEAPDPVHLRGLARWKSGAWTVDGGVALPFPSLVTHPSVQLLGQVRGSW